MKTLNQILQSNLRTLTYKYIKTHLFTFLINKIPFGRDILDKIHYYPFVQHHKQQLIMKYCREHKISNKTIVKEWYTDIIKDKINWPIVLEAVDAQINISDELYIKLKPEMKKIFISYANDVTYLTIVLNFYNVFQNLKLPMMDKLSCIKGLKNFNIVDTIFDEIIAESKFSTEMIRIQYNILSNKLDNDDIDINSNNLNIINLNQDTRKSRKRKYNIKDSDISNIKETSIIISSSKQLKNNQLIKQMSVHS